MFVSCRQSMRLIVGQHNRSSWLSYQYIKQATSNHGGNAIRCRIALMCLVEMWVRFRACHRTVTGEIILCLNSVSQQHSHPALGTTHFTLLRTKENVRRSPYTPVTIGACARLEHQNSVCPNERRMKSKWLWQSHWWIFIRNKIISLSTPEMFLSQIFNRLWY